MEVEDILKKYSKKIEKEIHKADFGEIFGADFEISKDYKQFKKDMMPELSRYESWCKKLGSFFKIRISLKDSEKIQKELAAGRVDLSAQEVVGLAFFCFFMVFVSGILISLALFFFDVEIIKIMFFFLLVIVVAGFLYYYFSSMPPRLALKWKLKASSQMVPAVLYTVVYMKQTSNLERAISFVSQHIEAPLALDFKKVLWDVETGKYSSVKDSLDSYLEFWKDSNMEFVESFHLIESSLYEPNENRRIQILERALKVVLDGVYEKMLKYTHTVKAPLTNLYMLGIMLPTLGLPLIVLASTLLGGIIQTFHIFVIFNLIFPFFVFYLTTQIMLKRPGGYGEESLIEKNPHYPEYVSKKHYYIAAALCLPLFLIGVFPLIVGYTPVMEWLGFVGKGEIFDVSFASFGLNIRGGFFEFLKINDKYTGPYGFGAVVLSVFVPLSIALFFVVSYRLKTKQLIKAREQTKELEEEFNSSLFALGNRLGDGMPAEIAFSKVADSLKGQRTADFFKLVNNNIQAMGMGIEEAIFNPKRGALVYYPSSLIATSMRILVESVKKGLNIAAESLMSISEYVRNVQKINERLRDLLADIVSDMKSNMTFLAPLLAGIVVGLSAMISGILTRLQEISELNMGEVGGLAGGVGISQITKLFRVESMIPPYFLQIVIGIYIVEITFILTQTLVGIDSGEDRLKRTYEISKNLFRSILLYSIVCLLAVILLYMLVVFVLGGF